MFVKMDVADLHLDLIFNFGLPKYWDRCDIEVFGPYHIGDNMLFWEFNPTTKVWDVKQLEDYEQRDVEQIFTTNGFWPKEEDEIVQEKLRALAYFPRPSLPRNPINWKRRPAFIYEGWTFEWSFSAIEHRWTLLPTGRSARTPVWSGEF